MLELPKGLKPEKERKAREDDMEGGREEPVGDLEREDRGDPEQAWRVFNLTPPPPTPEFSRLGQDPAPIKWERQVAKLLPPRPFLRSHGQMVGSTIMHAMDGRGNGPGWGLQRRWADLGLGRPWDGLRMGIAELPRPNPRVLGGLNLIPQL